jgi:hypothetical protein
MLLTSTATPTQEDDPDDASASVSVDYLISQYLRRDIEDALQRLPAHVLKDLRKIVHTVLEGQDEDKIYQLEAKELKISTEVVERVVI